MEIGEKFDRWVVGVTAPLETVPQQHALRRALEMLAVKLVAMSLEKDMASIDEPVAELFGERLCLRETGVNEGWAVRLMLLIARQCVVGIHVVSQEDASRDAAFVEKAVFEKLRDADPVFCMVAVKRVYDDDRLALGLADLSERALQSFERLANGLDDRHETGRRHQRRHLPDRNQLELLAAEIGVIHEVVRPRS